MKVNIQIPIIAILIILISCSKEPDVIDFRIADSRESLENAREKIGMYADFINFQKNGVSVLGSLTSDFNQDNTQFTTRQEYNLSAYFQNDFKETKDAGFIKVNNDLLLNYNPNSKKFDPSGYEYFSRPLSDKLETNFGKMTNIKQNYRDKTILDETFYVPQPILEFKFNNTNLDKQSSRKLVTKKTEFIWNSDPNNKNGLLVTVMWDGQLANTDPLSKKLDKQIRKAYLIKIDDGQEVLPDALFSDFPKDAIFYIQVYRGFAKITNADKDGIEYPFHIMFHTDVQDIMQKG